MAYTSFTTPGSYEQVQSELESQARRRKVIEALQAQNLKQSDSNRMVSGRVVPYGLGEGLTKLASALLSRSQLKDVDSKESELSAEKSEMKSKAAEDVLNTIMGKDAVNEQIGEFDEDLGGYNYEPKQEAIESDPMRGAIQGMTTPELEGSGMDKVALAMLKQKGSSGRGAYSRIDHITVGDKTVPVIIDTRGVPGQNITTLDGESISPNLLAASKFTSPAHSPEVKKEMSKAAASGKVVGESQATAEVDMPSAESTTGFTLDSIDKMINHPGMKDAVGVWDNPLAMGGMIPGTDAAGFNALFDQIKGKTFKEIYEDLKGGGQITEIEGSKGEAAINRLNKSTSEKEFMSAANDFKTEVLDLLAKQRIKAGMPPKTEENIMKFDSQGNLIE